MEIPGNSHGLVPGDTRTAAIRLRGVAQGDGLTAPISSLAGDPFTARFIGLSLPVAMVGWGYDIFGRPVPGKNTIQQMNGLNNGSQPVDYSLSRFNSGSGDGAKMPFGGEALSSQYVAGMLDVKYDPRHGLWKTHPVFLAEITGVVATGNSLFTNLYGWREIELQDWTNPDPFQIPVCPARSYEVNVVTESDKKILNFAINLSESASDIHDRVFYKVPSGTVVEMRSINVFTSGTFTNSDPGTHGYSPIYVFNQATTSSCFIKILGFDGTYPAPLSNQDKYEPSSINYFAGKMCSRFLYKGVVVSFSGGDLSSTDNSSEMSRYNTPFGNFIEELSIPTSMRFVDCINLNEMGNPVGKRGMVCPGVVTATGSAIEGANFATAIWPDGIPNSIVLTNAKSSYPKGFAIQPICSGTIVEARRLHTPGYRGGSTQLGPVYYFNSPNAHDGGCASGIFPAFGPSNEQSADPGTTRKRPAG